MKEIQNNRLYQFFVRAKVFVFIFVLGCAVFDFLSIRQLFVELDYGDGQPLTYALVLAMFLEGIPVIIGKALYEWKDETKYDRGSKVAAKVGFWMSAIAFLLALGIYVYLRRMFIIESGGYEGFKKIADRYDEANQFYGEIFRLITPFITSLGAFALSFYTFRESSYEKLDKHVKKLKAYFNRREKKYLRQHNRYKNNCMDLWSTLADADHEEMPETYEAFREECMIRIRHKLTENCVNVYPTQIERYSAEVESALAAFMIELSKHSTLPNVLNRDIRELLEEYDEQVNDPADQWDYNAAGKELTRELEKSLGKAFAAARLRED